MKDKISRLRLHTSAWQNLWSLDPDVVFLNHGSFGACPLPVLAAQQRLRQQLEREPVRFFMREFEALLDDARSQLATFVGANPDNLAFVPNATTGVNTVLRSLQFERGDELLTTDQEYNACRNALDFVAKTGAQVVVAKIPFPIESPEQVVEAVMERVSPRTRLALIDHVTSQTGLVFPIQQIAHHLTNRGVELLVDGAHAPGMIPLNLQELEATYYTGNCHKWLCAPKGAAFLYVSRERHSAIRPLTISHGANSPRSDRSRFQLEFDWTGTDDPTAYLCVPEAIWFMGSLLVGGWSELMARNRAMVLAARQLLCQTLAVMPPCPPEMIGSMAVVPLLDNATQPVAGVASSGCVEQAEVLEAGGVSPLQDFLFEFGIEVPVILRGETPRQLIRVSAQLYNTQEQYEYLASVLSAIGCSKIIDRVESKPSHA